MPTTFTSLKTTTSMVVGSVLTVVGVITGASFIAPSGSDTIINSPSGKDVTIQVAGSEVVRYASVACTATGGFVAGVAKYDTCYLPSPLTTTGSLKWAAIECGDVSKTVTGDLSFVKSANAATGSDVIRGTALRNSPSFSTGTYLSSYGSGYILWNPADKLKLGIGGVAPDTFDCVLRVEVEDTYGD